MSLDDYQQNPFVDGPAQNSNGLTERRVRLRGWTAVAMAYAVFSLASGLLTHAASTIAAVTAVGIPLFAGDCVIQALRLALSRVRIVGDTLEVRKWWGQTLAVSVDQIEAVVFCSLITRSSTPRPFVGVIGKGGLTLVRIDPAYLSETTLRTWLEIQGFQVRGTFGDIVGASALNKSYPGLPDWLALNPDGFGLLAVAFVLILGFSVLALFRR